MEAWSLSLSLFPSHFLFLSLSHFRALLSFLSCHFVYGIHASGTINYDHFFKKKNVAYAATYENKKHERVI